MALLSDVALSAAASYSNAVIASIHRLPLTLRFSLLGLLTLAVLIRPIYSTWCETHQLSHTLTTLSHESFHQDSAAERQLDADHAHGAHGSLHSSDQGDAYVGHAAVVTMPVVQFDSVLNPVIAELPAPVQRLARPFRPPIA